MSGTGSDNLVCPNCKSHYFAIANKVSKVATTVANSQVLKCVGCDGIYEVLDSKLHLKTNIRA